MPACVHFEFLDAEQEDKENWKILPSNKSHDQVQIWKVISQSKYLTTRINGDCCPKDFSNFFLDAIGLPLPQGAFEKSLELEFVTQVKSFEKTWYLFKQVCNNFIFSVIFAFCLNFHAFYLLLPSNCLRWLSELLTGRIYHREWFSFLFCFDVPDKASAGFVASLVFFFTFVFVLYKFLLGIFASSCRSRLERSRSQDMRSKRILKLGNGWCSLFRIIAHVYSLELNKNI